MAKQNADTQIVQNQNPDGVVVFLRIDDRGQPIRDMASTIVPDIHDVSSISLAMGHTGATGTFSIQIANTNNKYFIADDMETEIQNLKEGTIRVGTSDTGTIQYNTLSASTMWGNSSDFLNNRAYNRLFLSEDGQNIRLYYQDVSSQYEGAEPSSGGIFPTLNIPTEIKKLLAKGKLKYRSLSKESLESFANQTTNVKAPTTSTNPPADNTTPEDDRALSSFYSRNDESSDTSTPRDFPENTKSFSTEEDIQLQEERVKRKASSDPTAVSSVLESPEYNEVITVPLEEAVNILMKSDTQSAFFEKYGGQLEHGRCVFEPMQLCVVFLPRRFKDASDPNDLIISFVGFVDNVQDKFIGSTQMITIAGSDVTKLMRVTQANVNPSIFTGELPADSGYKIWQHTFGGLEGWQIIKILTTGGELDTGENAFGTGVFEVNTTVSPGADTVGQGILDRSTVSKTSLLSSLVMSRKSQEEGDSDKMDKLFFSPRNVHIQALPFDNSPVEALQDYDVFKKVFGMSFGNWENEYTDHYQIANDVANLTNYEFYADAFGDIWYHQPRFHNYHILNADESETYILRDEDIIESEFTESDEGVITSLYMTGSPKLIQGNKVIFKMAGFYEDPSLVLKYGRRMVAVNHPYVVGDGSIDYFLRSHLIRVNAGRFVGKVVLIGRPEIKTHMPVYVPYRNTIYYIQNVTHSVDFGSRFTTTLTLKYGHKPWEVIPEILQYNEKAGPRLTSQKPDRNQVTSQDLLNAFNAARKAELAEPVTPNTVREETLTQLDTLNQDVDESSLNNDNFNKNNAFDPTTYDYLNRKSR